MKIITSIALSFVAFSSISQKKMSYKSDKSTFQLNYNHLPAIIGADKHKTYSLELTNTRAQKVDIQKAVGFIDIIAGKNYSPNSKELAISIVVKSITNNSPIVESVKETRDLNGAVTSPGSSWYRMPYAISYTVSVMDLTTNTVVLDSIFTANGYSKYPQDFGGTAPANESLLNRQYQKDLENTQVKFIDKLDDVNIKNAFTNQMKEKLTEKLGVKPEMIALSIYTFKTKDPAYEELNLAIEQLDAAIKEYRKAKPLTNFHSAVFSDKVTALLPVFEKYAQDEYTNKIEEEEDREIHRWGVKASLFSLYVMSNKYDKATVLFEEIANANIEQIKAENEAQGDAKNEKAAAIANLKTLKRTPAERAYDQINYMKGVWITEMTNFDAKKAYYNYER